MRDGSAEDRRGVRKPGSELRSGYAARIHSRYDIKVQWWPLDEEPPPRPEELGAHVPLKLTVAGAIQIPVGAAIDKLAIGDVLRFSPNRMTYTSDRPLSRLASWGRLKGVVLAVCFRGRDTFSVDGTGFLVAPGVAMSASHVFREPMSRSGSEKPDALLIGYGEHGRIIWRATHVRHVGNTDLCIVSLALVDGLPPDKVFHQAQVTTRTPRKGERLSFIGFVANGEDCKTWSLGRSVQADIVVSAGPVAEHHVPSRGDRALPGPTQQIDCETWGGMSGGPVVDDAGWVVGVVSKGYERGPSYVALAFPALACPFLGGWPNPGPDSPRSLLNMAEPRCGCFIERPQAIRASYPEGGSLTEYELDTWHDRT